MRDKNAINTKKCMEKKNMAVVWDTEIIKKISFFQRMTGATIVDMIENSEIYIIIKEGQSLIILPVSGVKHKIKSGDTIQGIAKLYGGDIQDLLRYNNISLADKLIIGETIIVPDGEIKGAPRTSSNIASTNIRNLPNLSG